VQADIVGKYTGRCVVHQLKSNLIGIKPESRPRCFCVAGSHIITRTVEQSVNKTRWKPDKRAPESERSGVQSDGTLVKKVENHHSDY
jgi:hypothetical protein